MKILMDLVTNQALMSALAGWLIAQTAKILLEIAKGQFSKERVAGGGGMPSAHSATVTALATGTAITCGLHSAEFAIAFFFAIIVMYDAMGVRYETGEEAKALNKLRERDIKNGKEPVTDRKLTEKLGHTPQEIAVGFLVGLGTAILVCAIIPG
ncbi:MAG: divergent PAP2 family protein [Chordicoccus sp.]